MTAQLFVPTSNKSYTNDGDLANLSALVTK